MKKVIRLTENDIRNIVCETINEITSNKYLKMARNVAAGLNDQYGEYGMFMQLLNSLAERNGLWETCTNGTGVKNFFLPGCVRLRLNDPNYDMTKMSKILEYLQENPNQNLDSDFNGISSLNELYQTLKLNSVEPDDTNSDGQITKFATMEDNGKVMRFGNYAICPTFTYDVMYNFLTSKMPITNGKQEKSICYIGNFKSFLKHEGSYGTRAMYTCVHDGFDKIPKQPDVGGLGQYPWDAWGMSIIIVSVPENGDNSESGVEVCSRWNNGLQQREVPKTFVDGTPAHTRKGTGVANTNWSFMSCQQIQKYILNNEAKFEDVFKPLSPDILNFRRGIKDKIATYCSYGGSLKSGKEEFYNKTQPFWDNIYKNNSVPNNFNWDNITPMKKVSENKKKIIKITKSDINNIICETINRLVNNNKPNLTVLWLDDVRQPEKYLAKQKQPSQTSSRNIEFYQRLMAKYNVQFVWVHNLDEFMNYITTHDMPGLVSFDFDLGRDILKGSECAKWLKQYCMENNKPLPKYYVHSANNKAQTLIPNELGTQTQLSEKVYMNDVNTKKKQIGLTYTKGRGGFGDGLAQQFKNDKLSTMLMDQNNSETIEKTLKGNIISYNITDIYGERVMHYFKKYFDHKKATVDVKYQNGETDEYELTMLQNQFNEFMNQFKKKIEFVINDVMQTFNNSDEITGISIYPVPSSSNFNIAMANELSSIDVNGLPIQVISPALFNKDLRDLQKDTEFIAKNKDWYNSQYFKNIDSKSLETYVDHYLNQYKSLNVAHTYIEKANQYVDQLINAYRNYNSKKGAVGKLAMQRFVNYYIGYYDSIKQAIQASTYDNLIDDEREQSKSKLDRIAQKLKYTKGPSVENRTGEIWNIVRRFLNGAVSPITGKEYKMMDVCYWQPTKFQIKNLTNGVRMGLKNIYNVNQDQEFVQNELNKIKNTLFVIFDDNLSGGATLGDVCYQAKSLGIENIIPITFGKMAEKNTINNQPLTIPKNINF